MNVAKIRFNDKDAPAAFTRSLKETGFGVITDHPIDLSLMEYVYNEWKQFFIVRVFLYAAVCCFTPVNLPIL